MAGYIGSKASVTLVDGYTQAEADAEFVQDPNGAITVSGSNVDVTGTITSDALRVETTQGNISIENSASSLNFARAGANYIRATDASGSFRFITGADDFATTALAIDSSGRVTTPYQPAFYGTYTNVNVAWASNQTFGWNVVHMNVGSHFNGATGRFTAPVTGVYSFNYNAWASSGPTQVCFKLNGTDWNPTGADTQGIANLGSADGSRTGGATIVIPLSAGDYVHVGMRNGFADTIYMGHSHFSGYLIG